MSIVGTMVNVEEMIGMLEAARDHLEEKHEDARRSEADWDDLPYAEKLPGLLLEWLDNAKNDVSWRSCDHDRYSDTERYCNVVIETTYSIPWKLVDYKNQVQCSYEDIVYNGVAVKRTIHLTDAKN